MITKGKKQIRNSDGEGSSRRPERNRQILIDATLDSIVTNGITDTSVSRIIEKAGLSRGMIHLHFGGKENLLVASAQAASEDYYAEMERAVAGKTDNPAELIAAVVRADLSEPVLNRRSVRIWHAFRGEAPTNAGIAQFSSTRDKRLRELIRSGFDDLALAEKDTDSTGLARDATYGTLALLEGMWTDFLAHDETFDRDAAARIVFRFLAGLFPGSF